MTDRYMRNYNGDILRGYIDKDGYGNYEIRREYLQGRAALSQPGNSLESTDLVVLWALHIIRRAVQSWPFN